MSAVEIQHRPLAEQAGALDLLLQLERSGAVTETQLLLTDPDLPYDTYESLGAFLGAVKRRTSWYIGDWLNFGEGVYGERFAQAAAVTGLNEQTLLHYQFVCRQVPESRRKASLAFGVHALVARMEPAEQRYWLDRAARRDWGEKELREAIKKKRSEQAPPLFPDGEEGSQKTVLDEVAAAILRDARPHDDGQHWLIPNEDMARLKAALGVEE